jgi:hypothetical protein
MAVSWTPLCRGRDLVISERGVEVVFADERRHRVTVEERDDAFLLSAIVARQSVVSSLKDVPLKVWQRNRATALVGFRLDQRGRLVGETIVPKIGLAADEFKLSVRSVATECDRFEFSLTGRDNE